MPESLEQVSPGDAVSVVVLGAFEGHGTVVKSSAILREAVVEFWDGRTKFADYDDIYPYSE